MNAWFFLIILIAAGLFVVIFVKRLLERKWANDHLVESLSWYEKERHE